MDNEGIKGFQELEPNSLLKRLVDFLDDLIPNFTQSQEFTNVLFVRQNENQYSTAFSLYLNNRSKSEFCFINENPQEGSSSVDIGVYRGPLLFYTIEAKILPTPLKRERKEYEYVYGKGGGIQRFKDRKHGVDNCGNPLDQSGIIAYVQDKDFEYWVNQINKWIDQANWGTKEKLIKVYFKSVARYKSKHNTVNDNIILDHFWIPV